MLRFLTEVQGVSSLLVASNGLGHRADDGGVRVATEGLLQDACQFTVTIVDKLGLGATA